MIPFLKNLTHWFIPHVCILCKNITNQPYDLCQPCLLDLPILPEGCAICANILAKTEPSSICGQCLQKKPPFDNTYGLFLYQPPIVKMILNLKFHHALANAKLLSELLIEKICNVWYHKKSLPAVIIPVPLHTTRLKERGFNQAVEIARPIAKALHLPLLLHDVVRIKPTLAQTTLTAVQRKQNIRNAFLVKQNFQNQHIAVLDDVITTGSTIHEFCRVLKKQGAGEISVWCCARTAR